MTILNLRNEREQFIATFTAMLLIVCGFLQFFAGCKAVGEKSIAETRMDSAVEQMHRVTSLPKHDSSGIVIPDPQPHSAYLGYAYPPELMRGEARILYAQVTVLNDKIILRENLRSAIIDAEGEDAKDTIIIYPRDILFYRSIHLTLTDPSNDFQIARVLGSDTQEISGRYGNRWQWSIVTQTDKPSAKLFLQAEGITPQGISEKIEEGPRVITIQIRIKKYILRAFFDYLTDNPAVSIPLIAGLVGFIGFLIRYFLNKKRGGDD